MLICIFTAVIYKEGNIYAAECPEVGTVSQGYTIEEAIANLKNYAFRDGPLLASLSPVLPLLLPPLQLSIPLNLAYS